MAQISIDINNAIATELFEAILATYGNPGDLPTETPGEKSAFVKKHLTTHLQQTLKEHRRRKKLEEAVDPDEGDIT